jgi:transcriptional regulator GlxA family with amidase domain
METGLTLSIWLVVTPNVLLLDYAGPAEALRMARDMGANFSLHTCSPLTSVPTTMDVGLSGLEPLPDKLPVNSLLLIVGNGNEVVDYQSAAAHAVVRWLKEVPLADTRLASICSGALLLGKAGCLAGQRCTTHHSLLDALKEAEPSAEVEVDRIFVDDGRTLTSAGISTGIDLALHIIEQYAGAALAALVARRLVIYQRRGPNDPQLSPWLAWRNHMHPAVHRAQDAVARDPAKTWSLEELADQACVSSRHLIRLFVLHAGLSIVAYQQQLRIAMANDLLKKAPDLSVERVSEQCGFASTRDFRRVWQRHAESTPSQVRHKARQK